MITFLYEFLNWPENTNLSCEDHVFKTLKKKKVIVNKNVEQTQWARLLKLNPAVRKSTCISVDSIHRHTVCSTFNEHIYKLSEVQWYKKDTLNFGEKNNSLLLRLSRSRVKEKILFNYKVVPGYCQFLKKLHLRKTNQVECM